MRKPRFFALTLFFFSGVTGLMHEILWSLLLRDVVDSTTEATGAVGEPASRDGSHRSAEDILATSLFVATKVVTKDN